MSPSWAMTHEFEISKMAFFFLQVLSGFQKTKKRPAFAKPLQKHRGQFYVFLDIAPGVSLLTKPTEIPIGLLAWHTETPAAKTSERKRSRSSAESAWNAADVLQSLMRSIAAAAPSSVNESQDSPATHWIAFTV